MSGFDLSQEIADELIAMPKECLSEERYQFPLNGEGYVIPLAAPDRHEYFLLDLHAGRINLSKLHIQTRGRQVIVLVRLDLGGAPHRNPNGETIPCPHLHVYREGYGDKWAIPVPTDKFSDLADHWSTLHEFMHYCQIVKPPRFEQGLFQ